MQPLCEITQLAGPANRRQQKVWQSCGSRSARCSSGCFSRIWVRASILPRDTRASSTTTSSRVIRRPRGKRSWVRRRAMRQWQLQCRRRWRSHSGSCCSLVCLRVQQPLSHSCTWPVYGSRNGVRHGFGNCSFPCLRRSDSPWDVPVVPGASTLCWHGGARRLLGGDKLIPVRVSVIIPTHNEALAIGKVLADLPSNLISEVIVVDSNSIDGTPDLARAMGAQVIQEPQRGYGRACLTGLANTENPDVVVFLDGDYSDRPSELPILLAPIIEGRADITIGSRLSDNRNPDALPWHQAFGNHLSGALIRLLYGVKVSDLGPFRAGRA